MGVASTIGGLAFVLAPIVFNKIIYEVSKLGPSRRGVFLVFNVSFSRSSPSR